MKPTWTICWAVLARVPSDALTVLLVGHNPGLEELVRFLTDNDLDEPDDGKLMPTAGVGPARDAGRLVAARAWLRHGDGHRSARSS